MKRRQKILGPRFEIGAPEKKKAGLSDFRPRYSFKRFKYFSATSLSGFYTFKIIFSSRSVHSFASMRICKVLGIWRSKIFKNIHQRNLLYMNTYIQGDSGGICITLGNDSMSDSKQKSSYEHGSDFERLRSYDRLKL